MWRVILGLLLLLTIYSDPLSRQKRPLPRLNLMTDRAAKSNGADNLFLARGQCPRLLWIMEAS
jgi:hypothetical protein